MLALSSEESKFAGSWSYAGTSIMHTDIGAHIVEDRGGGGGHRSPFHAILRQQMHTKEPSTTKLHSMVSFHHSEMERQAILNELSQAAIVCWNFISLTNKRKTAVATKGRQAFNGQTASVC